MNDTLTPTRLKTLGTLLLFISGLLLTALINAAPAQADDTDGGSGSGSGTGGDGCTLAGWTMVVDPDQIVWQADGSTASCGNTGYGNRAAWTSITFNDNNGNSHTCTVGSGCTGSGGGNWVGANAPLYTSLQNMSANACFKRLDVNAIWYLTDAPEGSNPASFTNLGGSPRPYPDFRNVLALKDAIDDTTQAGWSGLYQSNGYGTNAWWDAKTRQWMGASDYDAKVAVLGAATVRQDMKNYLKGTILDVAGANPVIFCWYKNASSATCGDVYPSQWNNYLHPAGVTQSSPYSASCFLRCPTTQGQYPNPLPHAGEWIPASVTMAGAANWCYPPITYTWHQGGYGSTIPGVGYTYVETLAGNNYATAQPYAYITSAEDGNGAYNSATLKGNAPGQGQLTVPAVSKASSFTAFWNSYCGAVDYGSGAGCSVDYEDDSGQGPSQAFINAYNAAVAALPNDTHASLDLSTAQKNDVAKGRIMNVYERTKYASAEARRYLDQFWVRTATLVQYYDLNGNALPSGATFSAWAVDRAAHPTWNSEAVPAPYAGQYRPDFSVAHPDLQRWSRSLTLYSTPKVSGLWQNASTHCNNQEFSPLNPAGTASGTNDTGVLDTGDSSQYYSASAVHKVSDSKWRVNETVDLTQARWGALAAGGNSPSAKPAFFDRLCYYPGAAKTPTTNADKVSPARPDYTFFRDGVSHIVQGDGGAGDSPYFVPSFAGEDRTTTVTIVDGYTAERRTQTAAPKWNLDWDQYEFNGTYTYNAGSPAYYAGTYAESWGCNIPRNQSFCTAPNGNSCGHSSSLLSGNWGWATYIPANNTGGCVNRYYYVTNSIAAVPASNTPNYQWNHHQLVYTTAADGAAGLAYCQSAAPYWVNCSLVAVPASWSAWSAPISVPSCPQTNTATTEYRNCLTLTHTESTTTNYNVVQYNNTDPTQVIVTRDPLGTPETDWMSVQGLTATGGTADLFSTDPTDTTTPKSTNVYQQQFVASAAFKSSTVAVADGGYKRLQAKALWASSKGLPQVVTLAWYFAPNVDSRLPVTNIGYGRAGGLMTYNAGNVAVPVRGRVEAEAATLNGPNDGKALAQHQDEVWANTGTNIVDGLNVPLFYGATRAATAPFGWTSSPTGKSSHYYVIGFRRVVGEGGGD